MNGNFVIGIDLGQQYDHTALAIVERLEKVKDLAFQPITREDHHHVRYIKRWPLGTAYRAIVAETGEMMRKADLREAVIVLDGTGVGKAVSKLFFDAFQRRELGVYFPASYVITGGREVTNEVVPKRELVGKLQTLLESGRLKVADSLPEAAILKNELLAFRVKTTTTGQDSFEALRERDHDDMVLAVALGCWYRHEHTPPRFLGPEMPTEVMRPYRVQVIPA